ncbi:MAG: hypothetical protein FWC60_10910 [Firmicutes bacterium]|nr:hypothetical protein [Bacillota bacterium]
MSAVKKKQYQTSNLLYYTFFQKASYVMYKFFYFSQNKPVSHSLRLIINCIVQNTLTRLAAAGFLPNVHGPPLNGRRVLMANLSQSEVNSIREVVMAHQTMACKLSQYANDCNDTHVKQMFTKASQDARNSAQNLIQML